MSPVASYCRLFVCSLFAYCCASANMYGHKLLSNTPVTTYCPRDSRHIYRIYEKHPELAEISMCCGTRINRNFILTEKVCLKKFDPNYVTVQSCMKRVTLHVQNLYTQQRFADVHGVLLIEVYEIAEMYSIDDKPTVYNIRFNENGTLDWETNRCTIYGTTAQSNNKDEVKYYKKWTTALNNTVTVRKNCRQRSSDIYTKWLCPEISRVQFCDEDIGCPMVCDDQLIGIASQRYNWRIWSLATDCGNLDVETRYLFLNSEHVRWIKSVIDQADSKNASKRLAAD